MTGEPPRGEQILGCRPRAAKGGQTDAGNGGRRRHTARVAETSGGCWRVEGVGDVEVHGDTRGERRWGAGAT